MAVKSSRQSSRAVLVFLTLAALAAWWWWPLEDAAAWGEGAPPRVWALRAHQEREAALLGQMPRARFVYVPLEAISLEMKLALLVAEDVGFFSHGAIDPQAILDALSEFAHGKRLRGASTITQQLAKNLFTSGQRSWWRKLAELRMAMWLERRLGKRRIFELYANVIELAPNVYGVEAAARYYFNTTAAQLSAAQAAGIAAGIPAPTTANWHTRGKVYRLRRGAVLERMRQARGLRGVVERLAQRR